MNVRVALCLLLACVCVPALTAAPVPPTAGVPPYDPMGGAFMGVEFGGVGGVPGGFMVVSRFLPNSAAVRSGMHINDEIIGISTDDVPTLYTLRMALKQYRPGAVVPITVKRGDEKLVIRVRLGEADDAAIGPPYAQVIEEP